MQHDAWAAAGRNQRPGLFDLGFCPIRFSVSPSSASISSTVGKADCNAFGSALVNSYVEMPIGLSMPAKQYSAGSRSCSWHKIRPMVGQGPRHDAAFHAGAADDARHAGTQLGGRAQRGFLWAFLVLLFATGAFSRAV